jgi:hypothetical protein
MPLPVLGPTQRNPQFARVAFLPKVRLSWREVSHSPPFCAMIKVIRAIRAFSPVPSCAEQRKLYFHLSSFHLLEFNFLHFTCNERRPFSIRSSCPSHPNTF